MDLDDYLYHACTGAGIRWSQPSLETRWHCRCIRCVILLDFWKRVLDLVGLLVVLFWIAVSLYQVPELLNMIAV